MALSAKDLRIGNLVFDDQNVIAKIESIQSKEYSEWNGDDIDVIFSIDGNMKESTISPIPLSEEWLLKAGFIKQGVYYCKDFVHNNLKIKLGAEIYGYLNFKYFNHIQHAHQLQNLYFALTGSELVFFN